MFKRAHHQAIQKILNCLNAELLLDAGCYFGGGTAGVLLLGEYRESVDIDFLCSSNAGFRCLRQSVLQNNLGALVTQPIQHLREVRADMYGIRTFVEMDGLAVKIEFISEARISLSGGLHPRLGVPTLTPDDMVAEKLLANSDRGYDASVFSRDIIDLAMMIAAWGGITLAIWEKVEAAYGASVRRAFHDAVARINNDDHLKQCLQKMKMDLALVPTIQNALNLPLVGS
jgi:Nucleotidyl transferase AbiEii toxin, Type IV TA system